METPNQNLQKTENEPTGMHLITQPSKLYSQLMVRTVDEVMASPNKALSGIKRDLGPVNGPIYVQAFLVTAVNDLVDFFNLGKTMSAEQVVQTVNYILMDFWQLKPEDFKLCFDNIKRGKYGQLYNRIDGAVILDCLRQYFEARTEHVITKGEAEHARHKSDVLNARIDREMDREKEARTMHEIAAEQYRLNQLKKDDEK